MLMSRRVPPSRAQTLRLALWPSRSWRRSFRYAYLRLARLQARPRHIALGVAAGIFVAILPIPGLQLLAAAALAWLIRGHSGAALLATFAANPVTYPLIWIASYAVGATLLGTPVADATHDLDAFTDIVTQSFSSAATISAALAWPTLWPILATLMTGALPLAALSAVAAYVIVWRLLQRRASQPPSVRIPPSRGGRRARPAPSVSRRKPGGFKAAA